MLLLVRLFAGCPVDPEAVEGDAVEVGANDPVWDPASIPVFRLTLPEDWEARLTALIPTDDCADREWIVGSLAYENPQSGETETYADIGVRYRGHSALSEGQRFGLKLLFDTTDEAARFHEMQNVNLLGSEGDYSLLRERVAQLLMAEEGVPAPRVNHARLYVNGEFQGLFPIAEEADDQAFLAAHFDDPDGHLYKVEGYCGGTADFEDKGDDFDDYDKKYEAKAGTMPEDAESDLIPMIKCANGPAADLETCLPTWVDVDEWLTEMAVDAVMPDVDGLAGAGQNFMIYADPTSARLVVYAWDKDQAFYTSSLESRSIFDFHPPWGDSPVLTQTMRSVWKTEYCAKVIAAAEVGLALDATVADLAALLEPYVASDALLVEKDWASQVASLRDSLAERAAEVKEEAAICSPAG